MWPGLSIGMHAFPSTHDLSHIFGLLRNAVGKLNPLAIVGSPLVVILYGLNFLRFFWADLIYGIAIGVLGPLALFKALI